MDAAQHHHQGPSLHASADQLWHLRCAVAAEHHYNPAVDRAVATASSDVNDSVDHLLQDHHAYSRLAQTGMWTWMAIPNEAPHDENGSPKVVSRELPHDDKRSPNVVSRELPHGENGSVKVVSREIKSRELVGFSGASPRLGADRTRLPPAPPALEPSALERSAQSPRRTAIVAQQKGTWLTWIFGCCCTRDDGGDTTIDKDIRALPAKGVNREEMRTLPRLL